MSYMVVKPGGRAKIMHMQHLLIVDLWMKYDVSRDITLQLDIYSDEMMLVWYIRHEIGH